VGSLVFFFALVSLFCAVVSGSSGLMIGSICVKGKTFELSGGGGVFPFIVIEFSGRKRFYVTLSLEEFCWLSVEWVRFCSSKRDPLWVKTFRWNHRFWLLQLRKNFNGRFIMLPNFTNSSQSRSIIFLEGPYADG